MRTFLLLTLVSIFGPLVAQNWIDLSYDITTERDIIYGTAIDFAGQVDTLKLDISYPEDDTPPSCGRPLVVIVHGGGWLGGDKNSGYPRFLRQDYASRGYVAVSVSYRLGMFHTDQFINCNVDGWNCLNMTDSSEFYRANYRAIQDVNGALRFLVNNAEDYTIDADNVFLIGESAGGFVAMGVGFLDDPSEVLSDLTSAYPDAPPPNQLYEQVCIQQGGLASSIAEMDLSRPPLGSYTGDLNWPLTKNYQIKAVGNIYGGAFNNIFQAYDDEAPALYMYHQPCDLIVPFNYNRVFAGLNQCARDLGGCANITNRPYVYGSRGIKTLLDTMLSNGIPTSDYLFDNSNNNTSCLLQFFNPSLGCHAIDSYTLRTANMANYFSNFIGDCTINNTEEVENNPELFSVYPNPASDLIYLESKASTSLTKVVVSSTLGQQLGVYTMEAGGRLEINISDWSPGMYFLVVSTGTTRKMMPFIKK